MGTETQVRTRKLFTDGTETYVAKSLDALGKVISDHYGESYEEMTGLSVDDEFYEVDDTSVISIYVEEVPEGFGEEEVEFVHPDNRYQQEDVYLVRAPALNWAETQEAGFLCTTER